MKAVFILPVEMKAAIVKPSRGRKSVLSEAVTMHCRVKWVLVLPSITARIIVTNFRS